MGDPSGCPRHPRVPPLLHFPRPAVRCPRLAWTRCSEGGGVKVLDGEPTRITIISTSFFPPASVAGGNHFFGTMEKVSDVSPTSLRCLNACAKPGPYLSAWTLSSVTRPSEAQRVRTAMSPPTPVRCLNASLEHGSVPLSFVPPLCLILAHRLGCTLGGTLPFTERIVRTVGRPLQLARHMICGEGFHLIKVLLF